MPQLISPKSKIKIIPKEGELEITLNINISIDGNVTATADKAVVKVDEDVDDNDRVPHIMPDFFSAPKINFGKTEGGL